jgi:hypothetical protein
MTAHDLTRLLAVTADHSKNKTVEAEMEAKRHAAFLPIATYVAQYVMRSFDGGRSLRYLGAHHQFVEYVGGRWKRKNGGPILEMCELTVNELNVKDSEKRILATYAYQEICARLILRPSDEPAFASQSRDASTGTPKWT